MVQEIWELVASAYRRVAFWKISFLSGNHAYGNATSTRKGIATFIFPINFRNVEFLLLVGMPIVENEQKIREFLSFLKQFKKQTNQLLHLPNSGNTCIDFWGQKLASCSYERY